MSEYVDLAKMLLRGFEGFEASPYGDPTTSGKGKVVPRVGYGTDTVTLPDGTVKKVTAGMTVTKEDAERDLHRRVTTEFGPRVQRTAGQGWDKLTPTAQAALTSVAYNYGSIDKLTGLAEAARRGDSNAVADAIAKLPANARRRQREADFARGGVKTAPMEEVLGLTTPSVAIPKLPKPVDTNPFAIAQSLYKNADAQDLSPIRRTQAPQVNYQAGPIDYTKYFN